MDDTISRAKAIKALSTITMYKGSIPYNTAVMRIEQLPSAQPKRAKWERHYSRPGVFADLCWHCSACGYKSSDGWANKFNFCPNCGSYNGGET